MQTINGSDLPEVPTHSHSENESKAKPSKEIIIKMYMGSDYILVLRGKSIKYCLGWHKGK